MATLPVLKSPAGVESDGVQVTFEDQQRINKYATGTSQISDLKEEVETMQNELRNLDDAADELLLAGDDDEAIEFMVGEVFINFPGECVTERIEHLKDKLNQEIEGKEKQMDEIKQNLDQLKVLLYGKFGSSINLEMDE